ncbi:hypothetical protein EPI10_016403 [Gossypium australe]|uniref:Uncharacterized protein n=1 Tax=Gossypium australe TaxID=47621 RepID=A0A5B6VNU5_9ROSI|nr:hypothetical protein EPI10_016403 [Gossypium australe]
MPSSENVVFSCSRLDIWGMCFMGMLSGFSMLLSVFCERVFDNCFVIDETTTERCSSFDHLKNMLIEALVLTQPESEKIFTVYSDALLNG